MILFILLINLARVSVRKGTLYLKGRGLSNSPALTDCQINEADIYWYQ